MANRIKALLLAFLLVAVAASAQSGVDVSQAREIFSEIDGILKDLHDITGFKIKHHVPAEIITRDKVKQFLEQRMKEATSPEEIRVEELTLKKFGLVPQDFDLAKNTVDLLTEQAAAFYDFHRKRMFITDWTPSATREPALVHELGHALADQNVNLDRFIKQGRKSDDGSLARMAVMEGQASWLMAEYLARKAGQSLATSPALLDTMAHSIESGASEFPVFESEPLYLRKTLVFPYSEGLLFQNTVYTRLKEKAFEEVFRRPPLSTQQILHPDTYFSGLEPARPALPQLPDAHGYKRIADGTVGELDHSILLEQYAGREESKAVSTHWRGGAYALLEHHSPDRVVFLYAVEWDDAASAARYFGLYRQVLAKKWKHFSVESESGAALSGTGDDGHFLVQLTGNVVTSIEGADQPIAHIGLDGGLEPARGFSPALRLQYRRFFQHTAFREALQPQISCIQQIACAMQNQIGGDAARGGRMHDAVAAETVRKKESGHSGCWADDGVVIRRDGVETRPGTVRIHLQIFEAGHAVHGVRQNLLYERRVERRLETGRLFRIVPRHQQSETFGAEVEASGHVDHHRQPIRQAGERFGGHQHAA